MEFLVVLKEEDIFASTIPSIFRVIAGEIIVAVCRRGRYDKKYRRFLSFRDLSRLQTISELYRGVAFYLEKKL